MTRKNGIATNTENKPIPPLSPFLNGRQVQPETSEAVDQSDAFLPKETAVPLPSCSTVRKGFSHTAHES
jgi:hypothetical protein